jgi:hypothetical protein
VDPAQREAVARKWLEATLATYPAETSRFLLEDKDPFRNPVGQAFKEALPMLVEEVLGAMDAARVDEALGRIVRIRAVQDLTPARAVSFVFLLKPILRDPAREGRVDELALRAFDLYMQCREKIWEIRAREAAGLPRRHS